MVPVRWVTLLLMGSGLCALIYQTVWLRELRLIFGASTPSSAAVLGIFMGGLGFGGLILGRRASQWKRPLEAYGNLELLIAILVAISPLFIEVARWVYLAMGGSAAMGPVPATLFRLVLSTLVLGPSVFLMGGTLPAAARAVTSQADEGRLALAALYGLNTIGAVLGVFSGTFFLFEVLGFRTTLWAACLINILVALAARALSKQYKEDIEPDPPQAEDAKGAASRRWLMLAAAFVTGFVFLLAELVWYRLSSPILGGSTYTFGVILGMALLGIGGGGLLYSLVGTRVKATGGQFALTCTLQAVCLVLPFAWGDGLAVLASSLRDWGATSFWTLAMGWCVMAAVLVLPSAFVAGYQFPLMMALKGQGERNVATDVGEIYAANTLGSIAGSLLGGFVLIPVLGAELSWLLCGGLLLILGVAFLARSAQQEPRMVPAFFVLAGLAAMCFWSHGPSAMWRHTSVGAGREKLTHASRNEAIAHRNALNRRVMEQHEGRESSLAFVRASSLAVLVNGKSDGDAVDEAVTTVGLGLVPAIIHGNPKTAYVIGLASGVTGGWLAEVPGMERVDVAEIEPDMLPFADLVAEANFNIMKHPKANVLLGDGRELLIATDARYDLIVSEPSNPYRAGIASFYTREFYTESLERLNEGGIFAQWIQGYEVDPEAIAMIARTMHEVFGHVSLWQLQSGDLLFLGTRHPQLLDLQALSQRAAQEPYKTFLGSIVGVRGAEGLLSMHLANEAFLELLATQGGDINTEDLPLLEFLFARTVGRSVGVRNLAVEIFRSAAARGLHRAPVKGQAPNWDEVRQQRLRRMVLPGEEGEPVAAFWKAFNSQDHAGMRRHIAQQPPAKVDDPRGQLALFDAQISAIKTPEQVQAALGAIEKLPKGGAGRNASLLKLRVAVAAGDPGLVRGALEEVVQSARRDPWLDSAILAQALRQLTALDDPQLAGWLAAQLLEKPFASYNMEQSRLETAYRLLTKAVSPQGVPDKLCAPFLMAEEPWPRWGEPELRFRAACYHHWNKPMAPQAVADLERFIDNRTRRLEELLPQPAPR